MACPLRPPSTEGKSYCFRWNNHKSNLVEMLATFCKGGNYVDCTIAVDDHIQFNAHRMVLAANSQYFQSILQDVPTDHCNVVVPGVEGPEMRALLDYMYTGEMNFTECQIPKIMRLAKDLKIKGLFENFNKQGKDYSSSSSSSSTAAVPQIGSSLISAPTRILPTTSNSALPPPRGPMLSSVHMSTADMNPLKRKMLSSTSSEPINCDRTFVDSVPVVAKTAELLPTAAHEHKNNDNLFAHNFSISENRTEKKNFAVDRTSDYAGLSSILNQKPEVRRYKKYSSTAMMSAIHYVRNGMAPLKAARIAGVPSRTLYDNIKKQGISNRQSMNLNMSSVQAPSNLYYDLTTDHE